MCIRDRGNAKVLNVIMLGVYVGYTEVVPPEVVWSTIEHKMAKKPKLLPLNKEAFEKGLSLIHIWLVPMVLTLNEKQMAVLSASFSFPQLITAAIGGVLAMLLVPPLRRAIKD